MVMINKSWIEKTAERLKLIKPLETGDGEACKQAEDDRDDHQLEQAES